MPHPHERGSAAVEATLATAFLLLLLSGGMIAAYLAFARVWLARNAYEGVICLATQAPVYICKQEVEKRIVFALPIGRVENMRLERSKNKAIVRLDFRLSPRIVLRIKDRRSLSAISPAEGLR